MRRRLLTTVLFAATLFLWSGCNRAPQSAGGPAPTGSAGGNLVAAAEAPPAARSEPLDPTSEFVIGEPQRHGNLTIFPVISRAPKTSDRFLTLDEGLQAGTVTIAELGSPAAAVLFAAADKKGKPAAEKAEANGDNADAQPEDLRIAEAGVNRLLVWNGSERPLYIMPGEIIIGGQQDRSVAHEYVIGPHSAPTALDVFCVESGRWGHRDVQATADLLLAVTSGSAGESSAIAGGTANLKEVAKDAGSGKFVGSIGNVNKLARIAVQGEKDQGRVWDRVASANAASGADSSSGAFTGNYADADVTKQLDAYIAALQRPVAEQSQVVGVLTAVNGRMDSLDIFESTPLFRRLWPKLLKSYALDAVGAPAEGREQLCTTADARRYLQTAAGARVQDAVAIHDIVTTTQSTDDIITFSAREQGAVQGMGGLGGGLGGFGGAIHAGGASF